MANPFIYHFSPRVKHLINHIVVLTCYFLFVLLQYCGCFNKIIISLILLNHVFSTTNFSISHSSYIYAFSRRFYPKRLTVNSGYAFFFIFFYQYVCSLGIEPMTFCAAKAMLYHWATGTQEANNLSLQLQCILLSDRVHKDLLCETAGSYLWFLGKLAACSNSRKTETEWSEKDTQFSRQLTACLEGWISTFLSGIACLLLALTGRRSPKCPVSTRVIFLILFLWLKTAY